MENLANPQDIQFLVSFHPPRVPIPISYIRELLNTCYRPPRINENLQLSAVIPQGPFPAHPLAPPQTIAYAELCVSSTFPNLIVVYGGLKYYNAALVCSTSCPRVVLNWYTSFHNFLAICLGGLSLTASCSPRRCNRCYRAVMPL